MFFRLYFTAFYQQVAAHAQMYHQVVILELNIYILGTASNSFYHLAFDLPLKLPGRREGQRTRPAQVCFEDGPADQLRAQATCDGFDFGEFRHEDYSLNISPTERPSWARMITSPSKDATERIVSLPSRIFSLSAEIGTVSVVMMCLIGREASR